MSSIGSIGSSIPDVAMPKPPTTTAPPAAKKPDPDNDGDKGGGKVDTESSAKGNSVNVMA
jgi:hypothetical protein